MCDVIIDIHESEYLSRSKYIKDRFFLRDAATSLRNKVLKINILSVIRYVSFENKSKALYFAMISIISFTWLLSLRYSGTLSTTLQYLE